MLSFETLQLMVIAEIRRLAMVDESRIDDAVEQIGETADRSDLISVVENVCGFESAYQASDFVMGCIVRDDFDWFDTWTPQARAVNANGQIRIIHEWNAYAVEAMGNGDDPEVVDFVRYLTGETEGE